MCEVNELVGQILAEPRRDFEEIRNLKQLATTTSNHARVIETILIVQRTVTSMHETHQEMRARGEASRYREGNERGVLAGSEGSCTWYIVVTWQGLQVTFFFLIGPFDGRRTARNYNQIAMTSWALTHLTRNEGGGVRHVNTARNEEMLLTGDRGQSSLVDDEAMRVGAVTV